MKYSTFQGARSAHQYRTYLLLQNFISLFPALFRWINEANVFDVSYTHGGILLTPSIANYSLTGRIIVFNFFISHVMQKSGRYQDFIWKNIAKIK